MRQTGISASARPARYRPRVAATRGERHLVGPHRARQRVAPDAGDQLGPADDQPCLRSADQLVAAERHDVGPGSQSLSRHRLMGEAIALRRQQRARTEVVDDDRAVLVREIGQGRRVRYLREAGLPEVGWMDPKHDARATFGQRRLEVRNPGPVRRPDLDELHAGAPQDLRYADAATDLDELAAPDDHAGALAGQADGQGDRRSVVVRDEGVLGARSARGGAPRLRGNARRDGLFRDPARGGGSRARPRLQPRSPLVPTAPVRGWCGR